MIEFRKCYPEHVLLVQAQSAQKSEYALRAGHIAGNVCQHGVSMSGWVDNRCVAVAGLTPVWSKAWAWALLSDACRYHMPAITAKIRSVIKTNPFPRIELTVLPDFEPAHRWAKALGFECEAPLMRKYDPDGRDMALYAMVRE